MAARYKKILNTKYTKKYKLYTDNKNPMLVIGVNKRNKQPLVLWMSLIIVIIILIIIMRKEPKYSTLPSNYIFQSVAFETLGPLNASALNFLSEGVAG